jgi:hypothetical protein
LSKFFSQEIACNTSGILGQLSIGRVKVLNEHFSCPFETDSTVDSSFIAAGEVWTANPPNRCNSDLVFPAQRTAARKGHWAVTAFVFAVL